MRSQEGISEELRKHSASAGQNWPDRKHNARLALVETAWLSRVGDMPRFVLRKGLPALAFTCAFACFVSSPGAAQTCSRSYKLIDQAPYKSIVGFYIQATDGLSSTRNLLEGFAIPPNGDRVISMPAYGKGVYVVVLSGNHTVTMAVNDVCSSASRIVVRENFNQLELIVN